MLPLFGCEWSRVQLFLDESAEGRLLQGLYDSEAPYFKPHKIVPAPHGDFLKPYERHPSAAISYNGESARATVSVRHFSTLYVCDSTHFSSFLIISLSMSSFPVLCFNG